MMIAAFFVYLVYCLLSSISSFFTIVNSVCLWMFFFIHAFPLARCSGRCSRLIIAFHFSRLLWWYSNSHLCRLTTMMPKEKHYDNIGYWTHLKHSQYAKRLTWHSILLKIYCRFEQYNDFSRKTNGISYSH